MLLLFVIIFVKFVKAEDPPELKILNELPIEKLLRIRNSLHEFSHPVLYENSTFKDYNPEFQAMALQGMKINKKYDYDEGYGGKDDYGHSKVSSVFAFSVTTLSFLAFGGYLLCLIIQALKYKQQYYSPQTPAVPTPTVFVSAGVRRPSNQVTSYGRRRRKKRETEKRAEELEEIDNLNLEPQSMFEALIDLCEGYAKWENVK